MNSPGYSALFYWFFSVPALNVFSPHCEHEIHSCVGGMGCDIIFEHFCSILEDLVSLAETVP